MTGRYKWDINKDNVLGTKGVLAKTVVNLFKKMWIGEE